MRQKTIEQHTGDAILQKPFKVSVGAFEYEVAPPTVATLILASEAISMLPAVENDGDRVMELSYRFARDCRPLGDVIAILILGARNLSEPREMVTIKTRKLLFGLIRYKRKVKELCVIDRKAELSSLLLETLSPSELNALFTELTKRMELSRFFALTTFLTEINLLRPTKVEN